MHIKRYKQIGRVAAATKLHMHYFLTLNMNYTTYFTELRWEIYKYDHVNLCDSFNLFQCPYVLLKKEENSCFAIRDPPSKISTDHSGNFPAKSIILVSMKIVVNSITNLKYSEV